MSVSGFAATKLIKDKINNLYIPVQHQVISQTAADFEIYLSGQSIKGGLMLGKSIIIDGKEIDTSKTEILPYFIKFTKENIPITLQYDEYVQFISCGLQHSVLATNYSKCYLFGDFKYNMDFTESGFHFALNLPFKINENTLYNLPCKITHLDCGEQFVIIKDELNRFWFAGKSGFGNGENYFFEFLQLNNGSELQLDLTKSNNITKVVAGGRHAAICIDDKFIYAIGNNYHNQLGFGNSATETFSSSVNVGGIDGFSFVKFEWNLKEEYRVKDLTCSGNSTIILTKCGKVFKTMRSQSSKLNL
ncbi:hypothetical protein ABK040_006888 [Willaertia magna]